MIALDSSVIVAALLSWHESHGKAARALDRALGSTSGLLIPAHALVETYAVLTRLPAPHRISPADAFTLLQDNLGEEKTASLPTRELWPLLRRLAASGFAGGVTYDALILETAKSGGATALLTLNARDCVRFDSTLSIEEP